jgi:hypothetical protein
MIQEHLFKRPHNQELGTWNFPVKRAFAARQFWDSVLEKSTISGVSGIK